MMKNLLTIILTALIAIFITACGDTKDDFIGTWKGTTFGSSFIYNIKKENGKTSLYYKFYKRDYAFNCDFDKNTLICKDRKTGNLQSFTLEKGVLLNQRGEKFYRDDK